MQVAETPPLGMRCHAYDTNGITARIQGATWECATCGQVEPRVEVHAGYAYIRRQRCSCQQDAERQARRTEDERQVQAQRDRERMRRAIGGMEPGMRAWRMRFATFEPDCQRQAYDLCVHWTRLVHETAHAALQAAHQLALDADGAADPLAVQMRFLPLWHAALAHIPNVLVLGPIGTGKSHLLLSIYHDLIDHDIATVYAPGMALLDEIRQRWDRDDPDRTEEQLIARLIAVEILLVDSPDICVRPWAATRWFRVLDGRANHGRPTVVAGVSARRLQAALGAEGADRLWLNGCVAQLHGGSYRRDHLAPGIISRRLEGTRVVTRQEEELV